MDKSPNYWSGFLEVLAFRILVQLTNRFKWLTNGPLISFGDLDILKENNIVRNK